MIRLLNYSLILLILLSNLLLSQDKKPYKSESSKKVSSKIKKQKSAIDKEKEDHLELFDEVFSILKRSYVDSVDNSEIIFEIIYTI